MLKTEMTLTLPQLCLSPSEDRFHRNVMTEFHLHRGSVEIIKQVNICCHGSIKTFCNSSLAHCLNKPNFVFMRIIILDLFTSMISK